jgi:hypothetical protein
MPAKYSVFSIRHKDVAEWYPVGIAMWCPELAWVQVRIVSEAELPRGLPKDDYPLIEALKDDLYQYQSAGYLAKLNLRNSLDEFWALMRNSMASRFRLSQEFTVLRIPLEDEMLDLYHKIVAPIIDPADWVPDSMATK